MLRVPEKGAAARGGAVGELTAERKVSSRDVSAGERCNSKSLDGMANVEFFDTPDLEETR
ncbi:MAG: hypothetical protein R3E96_07675 [Planctomycetota bacterium]